MDSLTQAALGALCGESVLRRKLGNWGILWGAIIGTLPDLDVLMSPWLDAAGRLESHRGLSHSLLVMLVGAGMIGWGMAKWHWKRGLTWREASWFVWLAWFTHVLIDCFTVYGTQVFEPFHSHRLSFDNLFIIDLFFTVPILMGLVLAMFWGKDTRKRGRLHWMVWGVISAYVMMSFGMKSWAKHDMEKDLAARGVVVEDWSVAPTLSNIFLWRGVAKVENAFLVSYWTPWDGQRTDAKWSRVERGPSPSAEMLASRDFQTLVWFSKGWWVLRADATQARTWRVVDLRFGEIEVEWGVRTPTFQWQLKEEGGKYAMSSGMRTRGQVSVKSYLGAFWERLCGRAPTWNDGEWLLDGKNRESGRFRL